MLAILVKWQPLDNVAILKRDENLSTIVVLKIIVEAVLIVKVIVIVAIGGNIKIMGLKDETFPCQNIQKQILVKLWRIHEDEIPTKQKMSP